MQIIYGKITTFKVFLIFATFFYGCCVYHCEDGNKAVGDKKR